MLLTKALLGFLYSPVDKDPHAQLAVRLEYAGGMVWTVSDGVLSTTVTGGPGAALAVSLTSYTMGSLVAFLSAQVGYSVPFFDETLSSLSALVLIDGMGDISQSNGDHILSYTSLLWSYYEAAAQELMLAATLIGLAPAQLSTASAQAQFLDLLGAQYGITRIVGESDALYGPRIPATVLRPDGNNNGMANIIASQFNVTGVNVYDNPILSGGFPDYSGIAHYDGTYHYNAAAEPTWGYYSVNVTITSGSYYADPTALFNAIVAFIPSIQDAGTYLRFVNVTDASGATTTFTAP